MNSIQALHELVAKARPIWAAYSCGAVQILTLTNSATFTRFFVPVEGDHETVTCQELPMRMLEDVIHGHHWNACAFRREAPHEIG